MCIIRNCAWGWAARPELSAKEQLLLFKKAGFDGFFSGFESKEQIADLAEFAKKENLVFSPFMRPFINLRPYGRSARRVLPPSTSLRLAFRQLRMRKSRL